MAICPRLAHLQPARIICTGFMWLFLSYTSRVPLVMYSSLTPCLAYRARRGASRFVFNWLRFLYPSSSLHYQMQFYISEPMEVDGARKVSTHGRRLNRRQEWRASKGLPMHRKIGRLNRQGTPAAARHSGKPKRRR